VKTLKMYIKISIFTFDILEEQNKYGVTSLPNKKFKYIFLSQKNRIPYGVLQNDHIPSAF
jgi:hypothetical protein